MTKMVSTSASRIVLIALVAFSVVNGQSLRNITVDDTDPAIVYSGSWFNGTGESDSYGGGHRSSTQANASATFTFTGVAVYYMMPLFEGSTSTLLTLDSAPAQLVNLTRVGSESTRSAVRWSATGLNDGNHTLVSLPGRSASGEVAEWGEVDGFIYTVRDSGSRPVSISSDDSRIKYGPTGTWTTDSTNVPSCALSKSGVRVTSTKDATFSFEFTGDSVFIHTINSPNGGKFSLSINGGPAQIYDTHANSTECGSGPPQKMLIVNLRRSDILRSRANTNILTGKNVDGTIQIDGITFNDQGSVNAAHRTIFMDCKFCAGAIFFISYLLFRGIF